MATPPRWPLARKGFRPFFFLGALGASALIPMWLLVLRGVVPPSAYVDPVTWHAHEMLFGFATAVIAGFLLTAVGNWTGRETIIGPKLLALSGVWLAGRVAMMASVPGAVSHARGIIAAVDLVFLPLLAVTIGWPLLATRNRRNFVMLGALAALFGCNVVMHLAALGLAAAGAGRHAALVALDVVIFLCLVIGGRVIPMFTRNGTGLGGLASPPWLDVAVAVSMVALVLADAILPASTLALALAGMVGLVSLARTAFWGTRHTLRHPLLWILHAGALWISAGMLLRAAPLAGVSISGSSAAHALTAGAIGALTIGMMARVALGHTGRPLTPPRAMTVAFVCVTLAALVRVTGISLVVSGALWATAFAIYVVTYVPVLFGARVDGKSG